MSSRRIEETKVNRFFSDIETRPNDVKLAASESSRESKLKMLIKVKNSKTTSKIANRVRF